MMRDLLISEYDSKYVLRRLASEGVYFLTIELPKVSRALLIGLEEGFFDRTTLTSFSFYKSTIRFMGQLLNQVFHERTGILLQGSSGAAIRTIRQLCEYSYKLALPYSKETEKDAKKNFILNEEILEEIGRKPEVLVFANKLRKDFETHWQDLSRPCVHEILHKFRPRPTNGTFVGCDELYYLSRNSTAHSFRYPSDVESFSGFYKPYSGTKVINGLKPITEPDYSELMLVPKDSRGPRTICRETLKRVETQMSFFDFTTQGLHQGSEGAINFIDQLVNRKIAEESSVSKLYSTLDLKDASDMVSHRVISAIFGSSPGLRWFISGSRRATSVLVDGAFKKLHKLAGMGSGLTFPTMSLLISLSICRGVLDKYPNLLYNDVRKDVFVYGDDICIKSEWADIAAISLAKIGLKVNLLKSFSKGNFRESCGGDYFYGLDVTPCRIKLANSKVERKGLCEITVADNANAFEQVYAHTKELWKQGFFRTAKYFMGVLRTFYQSKFGIDMVPGCFDEYENLPVDYTRGTAHIPLHGFSTVYAVRPVQQEGLDVKPLISRNGRAYRLSPDSYLSTVLKVAPRNQTEHAATKAACQENMRRSDPSCGRSFGELTVPRTLTFVKTEVSNTFIINSPTLDREDYLKVLRNDKFWNDCAVLMHSAVFHKAYL